jgi:hypothetical protein
MSWSCQYQHITPSGIDLSFVDSVSAERYV